MNNSPASWTWRPISTDAPRPTAKWITARVVALLSHFYMPDLPMEIEALAMTDWVAALRDIPQAAIEQAVTERIRSPERSRPTPGEIRSLAKARLAQPDKPRSRDNLPYAGRVVSPEELERRRRLCGRLAETHPMLRRIPPSAG